MMRRKQPDTKKKLQNLNNKLREYLIDKDDAYYYFFKKSHGFNIIVEQDGTIVEANDRAVLELGYDENEIKGSKVFEFIHKDYIESTQNELEGDAKFDLDFSFTNVWVGAHGNRVKILWRTGYQGRNNLIYAFGDVIGDDTRGMK
jgi:PAS domain S-box-containing protein